MRARVKEPATSETLQSVQTCRNGTVAESALPLDSRPVRISVGARARTAGLGLNSILRAQD